ncbi:hypothetical protein [Candidatus Uabimicrobium amorphum]|uniref:DUF3311 domain-containing protein n=1 Tax=Uabimicrobium amorphum TaxID=2596890 RepID=A0A5S9F4H1_UABAM|nr:hypothetical protein [Candidatus Uabimicrobium amorphum]BBM84222.1 hypothetical protein UABAM_02578 [Candidatus Uabimicrobium amorphum]
MKLRLVVVFAGILFLSQDYWNWSDEGQFSILGFPKVVTYFFVLQLALAVAIGLFSMKFWQEDQ